MSFTVVARGLYLEGLAIDGDTVWYSDVITGGVQGVHADGTTSHFLRERQWIGGVALNEDGAVLASGPGGIDWFDPKTGRTGTLVNSVDGVPLNGVNEMCPDGHGGMYFGGLDIQSIIKGQQTEPVALYRLAANGKVTQVSDPVRFSNGLRTSLDGKTLFHNESFVGTFAYDIEADGSLGPKRMLVDKVDVDGLVLDTRGYLWISGFSSEELLCVRPDGQFDRRLSFPGGAGTNVRFGGAEGYHLYVTAVPQTAGLELARGVLPAEPQSTLYRTKSPVQGVVAARTRFNLN